MGLRDYVIRRLILIVPTFFLISLIWFALIHLAPGDPVQAMVAGHPVDRELMEQLRRELGLDQPLPVQYGIWVSRLLTGNLGYSYISKETVWNLISYRIPYTLEVMLVGEFLSLIIAIVLGVIAAVKNGSLVDASCSVGAIFGYSLPNFWAALMALMIFSRWLGWLPSSGPQTPGMEFSSPFAALADHLQHLILPISIILLTWTAYLFRIVRSSMLDVLRQDYVTTARAKGLRERIVIYKHALRNALLPVVTYEGYALGFMLGGEAVLESIFAWPGLGSFMVDSARNRDYTSLMGLGSIIAIIVLVANLSADIAYALVDPRIRYD